MIEAWRAKISSDSYRLTFLSSSLFSIRMLIGAIHSLYLLSTGVSLQNLANLQIVFSTTVLLFELPTGIIADLYSRRLSIILACLSLFLFYVLCTFSPNLYLLMLSEFFYGVGLCLISGALITWLHELIQIDFPTDKMMINKLTHLKNEWSSIGSMVLAALGTLIIALGSKYFLFVYLLCAVLMLLLSFLFYQVRCDASIGKSGRPSYLNYFKDTFKSLIVDMSSSKGILYLVVACSLVVIYQPIFHYWQPLFMDLGKRNDYVGSSIESTAILLGVAFAAKSIFTYFFNRLARKWIESHTSPYNLGIISSIFSSLFIIGLSLFVKSNLFAAVALFSLFHGSLSLVGSASQSEYLKSIKNQDKTASILSAVALVSRVFGIIALSALALFVTNDNLLYFFAGTSTLFAIILIAFIKWKSITTMENIGVGK